ncbi:aldose epimerase family protein [Oceanomicrobium pacificus]|uniref:Aldose 1-epimerase n=1 Tax=Oceanomicrobium pacificus TaxID=2692916 RepID=A0A6B0TQ03_9RHOB|nr:aldose epimerase family protein [Oceanomicrobium pacificus]MXU66016.1 hypothetical protein [Oceanomicrobium pacificus]
MNDRMIEVAGRFGGQDVHAVTLTAGDGSFARIFSWGAVIADLQIRRRDGQLQKVVLGFDRFEPYPVLSPYFGAIAGRYANRIADGFTLGGRQFTPVTNEGAGTCLHGGPEGFGVRVWEIEAASASEVTLKIVSEDGDQGFPGRVVARCTYQLEQDDTGAVSLVTELRAETDAPTVINLTQHSYFNLDGAGSVGDHRLTLAADHVSEVDARKIPTGVALPVADTAFDYRDARAVADLDRPVDLDHNFILNARPDGAPAACLHAARSGLTMELFTNMPGLQVYDAHMLDIDATEPSAAAFRPRDGICLEPQYFPDSPNHTAFPSARLDPGETYEHDIVFRFSEAD